MADKGGKGAPAQAAAPVAQEKQFKGVRKLTWRGLQLEELVKLPNEKLLELYRSRIKRKFRKGTGHRFTNMIKKVLMMENIV